MRGYASHYLKANSPDGRRALWIKHTLLNGTELELWGMRFERGGRTLVTKLEIPGGRVEDHLAEGRAHGAIAGFAWDLRISGGLGGIRHLPGPLYRDGVPTGKVRTVATSVRFDGRLGDWDVDGWIGLHGHNWGPRHAWKHGWVAANLWQDGAPRAVEAFWARPRAWMPPIARSVVRTPAGDRVRWALGEGFPDVEAEGGEFVRLTYRGPDGETSVCRCTKFATVRVRDGHAGDAVSHDAELEFVDATDTGPAHPLGGWTRADGPYRWEG